MYVCHPVLYISFMGKASRHWVRILESGRGLGNLPPFLQHPTASPLQFPARATPRPRSPPLPQSRLRPTSRINTHILLSVSFPPHSPPTLIHGSKHTSKGLNPTPACRPCPRSRSSRRRLLPSFRSWRRRVGLCEKGREVSDRAERMEEEGRGERGQKEKDREEGVGVTSKETGAAHVYAYACRGAARKERMGVEEGYERPEGQR
ncbi:hypothetical protein K438DRAFT_61261 [Mycena galopus ATCC 62051]|nr:hypothetical protein K438DRAFT_61261 [Mycena galopus ATCC 62051]